MFIKATQLLFLIFVLNSCHAVPSGIKKETIASVSKIPGLYNRLKTFGTDVCQGWFGSTGLRLLIVVDSVTDHAKERHEIRYAWRMWHQELVATGYGGDSDDVRLMFFVGMPRGRKMEATLRAENENTGDLVWSNVTEVDVYSTLKTVMLLHWIRVECRPARFVLRIAENVIVNPGPLLQFVRQKNGLAKNTVWCFERNYFRPSYSDPDSYCDWPAYLMTGDVIDKLFMGALKPIPYFPEQNVFITGTVAKNEKVNVTFYDQFKGITLSSTSLPNGVNASDSCYYFKRHFVFVTFFDKNEWSFLMSTFLKCSKP